jgi:uridine kinase
MRGDHSSLVASLLTLLARCCAVVSCCAVVRDIAERGRTVESVIDQYLTTVKPAHEKYIQPVRLKPHTEDIEASESHTRVMVELTVRFHRSSSLL